MLICSYGKYQFTVTNMAKLTLWVFGLDVSVCAHNPLLIDRQVSLTPPQFSVLARSFPVPRGSTATAGEGLSWS